MTGRSGVLAVLGAMVLVAGAARAGDVPTARQQCRAHLREAVAHIADGRYPTAAAELDLAAACEPSHPDIPYHRGRILIAQGDTTGARTVLEAGVATAPLSSRLKLFLARIDAEQGDPDAALARVDAVLAVKPRDTETRYLKGCFLLARGDTAGAVGIWEEILEGLEADR